MQLCASKPVSGWLQHLKSRQHRGQSCCLHTRRAAKAGDAPSSSAAPRAVSPTSVDQTTWSLGPCIVPPTAASLQLVHPFCDPERDARHLLIYLPGTDGTGQSIQSQLDSLQAAGFDVWCLRIPPANRQGWTALVADCATLMRELTQGRSDVLRSAGPQGGNVRRRVTLVGESFGGCLALRLALEVPELLHDMVLLNPASCFSNSLFGVSSFVSSTNLLGLFPPALYNTAQSVMLPLLVDTSRVSPMGTKLINSMILMEPPPGLPVVAEEAGGSSSPAGAANFRAGLLRTGSPSDEDLRGIDTPTLLISSARDRVFPSIEEGARLQRLLPRAQRVILPDSAHAALLERGIDLAAIMTQAGLSPERDAAAPVSASTSSTSVRAAPAATSTSPRSAAVPAATVGSSRPAVAVAAAAAAVAAGPRVTLSAGAGWDGAARIGAASTSIPMASPPTSPSGSSASPVGTGGTPPRPVRSAAAARLAGPDPFAKWSQRLQLWRELVSPVVLGAELLPAPGTEAFARPMLFVGNHQKMGFYDTPLLVQELYLRGYRVRGLAHPGHWSGPVGAFFEQFGAVKASPMAAFRLLKAGEKVLLFPGGAREVSKKRGEEYTLLWKESPDFVRLAAKCGALIVPFAAVGADDAYDVVMDTGEVLANPVLGSVARAVLPQADGTWQQGDKTPDERLEESFWPITRLPILGLPTPVPIPNLQRLYFKFSTPIDTNGLAAELQSPQQADKLYRAVRERVEAMLQELLVVRSQDEDAQVGPRLSRALNEVLPVLNWPSWLRGRKGQQP